MEIANVQLTPEQRAALLAHPGEPVHILDAETGKVYLLFEEGALPELEEEYIRNGLENARDQIARGEVSTEPIEAIISTAQRRIPAEP